MNLNQHLRVCVCTCTHTFSSTLISKDFCTLQFYSLKLSRIRYEETGKKWWMTTNDTNQQSHHHPFHWVCIAWGVRAGTQLHTTGTAKPSNEMQWFCNICCVTGQADSNIWKDNNVLIFMVRYQDVSKYPPNNTSSQPKTMVSSATPMCNLKYLKALQCLAPK